MGTEIIAQGAMGSLTLAPNSAEANLLSTVSWEERDLTDEQFAIVVRVASASPPALPPVTEDDVRKLIGLMAGTLKAPRTSADEGKLKLAVYKRMLGHLPLSALQHATERALATLEWMPTPAELLRLADEHTAPERRLHTKAQVLARNRRQREFDERCKAVKARALSHDDLQALSDQEIRIGIMGRALLQEEDGTVIYWTLEDEKRLVEARRAETRSMIERITRAQEGADEENGDVERND